MLQSQSELAQKEQMQGLKGIAGIKANGKRSYTQSVLNKHGDPVSNIQSISDVFAEFYQDLYTTWESLEAVRYSPDGDLRSDPITHEEVRAHLKKMSNFDQK